jgi:hypothetical protein
MSSELHLLCPTALQLHLGGPTQFVRAFTATVLYQVSIKFNGQYLPCPAREQPDYDVTVAFNPNIALPVAAFEFKRRRRTRLWADDQPHKNHLLLRMFSGCPQQSAGAGLSHAAALRCVPARPGHGPQPLRHRKRTRESCRSSAGKALIRASISAIWCAQCARAAAGVRPGAAAG